MMDFLQKNVSFFIVLVCILLSAFLPIGNMFSILPYKGENIPKFNIPPEMQNITERIPVRYPPLIANKLTGEIDKVPVKVANRIKPKIQKEKLTVNAIMIDGNERLANINGSLLAPGSKIHSYVVLRIEKDSVLLAGPQGNERIAIRN